MPNKSQIDERETQAAFIKKQVLEVLGRPFNLRSVQVCRLWRDHYRVNVIVGESVSSVTLAHSYFLVVDGEGGLVSATPSITKQY